MRNQDKEMESPSTWVYMDTEMIKYFLYLLYWGVTLNQYLSIHEIGETGLCVANRNNNGWHILNAGASVLKAF